MNSFEKLADELSEAGLWNRLPAAAKAAAMEEVRRGDYPLTAAYDDVEGIFVFLCDGEDMSEGGVEEFLETVSGAMAEEGIPLSVSTAGDPNDAYVSGDPDDPYVVTINGEDCVVLENRLEADWLAATIRPLRRLNRLLAHSRSSLRWHTLYTGGNEGLALLIDPRVVRAMALSGLFRDVDLPTEVSRRNRPHR